MITYQHRITRKNLKDNPDTLYVFGDNMIRRGFGGQAKSMRGEPNAVGIPTKLIPSMSELAFFSNDDYDAWKTETTKNANRLLKHKGNIVWPADGIGTGLADLKKRAPKIFKSIENLRKKIENNRNGSTPPCTDFIQDCQNCGKNPARTYTDNDFCSDSCNQQYDEDTAFEALEKSINAILEERITTGETPEGGMYDLRYALEEFIELKIRNGSSNN